MTTTLVPFREREVGLRLAELAAERGIPSHQITLTGDGYVVPVELAEAYRSERAWIDFPQARTLLAPTPMAVLPPSTVGPVCFTKPGVVDLCVYRGDSGRVRVRVTDADAQPVDVSGATWDCDFRITEDDATVLCSPDIEAVVGIANAVDIVITPEQSAVLNEDCVWDLEMTLDGEVITVLAGKVLVTKDVSRT